MNTLTRLIQEDMSPALGVTEPGAIAYAASKAKSYTKGEVTSIKVALNSGMYKNAFTCGIPKSEGTGNLFSAALGVIGGNCEKGLESLADISPEHNELARKLVEAGKVTIKLKEIDPDIFIEATVETTRDKCTVTIQHAHTNIVSISLNNKIIFSRSKKGKPENRHNDSKEASIHSYTLEQLVSSINKVPLEELLFIREAYEINLALFEEGLNSSRTTFTPRLLQMNSGKIFSACSLATAQLLCNAAIEARVIGLDKPAMSITGSGAHGIIATMPLYAAYKVEGYTEEKLLRATALSYLITMYIKEYSGKLSAFCGCAIAAGTGMSCALVYLRDGTVLQMSHAINNMASSITGMICDGGNQGCTMKGIASVDTAFRSVEFAMNGAYVFDEHGINGKTPEETMRQMGLIASPGMIETEKTIIQILESKLSKS